MRQVRHPLVARDILGIARHIVEVTGGDTGAARRRLDEIDALIAEIAQTPGSGTRLSGALAGWRVRFGGAGRRLTVVFRAEGEVLYIALVAFGGRDWLGVAEDRQA